LIPINNSRLSIFALNDNVLAVVVDVFYVGAFCYQNCVTIAGCVNARLNSGIVGGNIDCRGEPKRGNKNYTGE